ncbi:hypothetical protein RZS08_50045, partial [Arthrospira platensis SPKY1]|nr:hypothetical protein [Arthrospira platensis SPKY1]
HPAVVVRDGHRHRVHPVVRVHVAAGHRTAARRLGHRPVHHGRAIAPVDRRRVRVARARVRERGRGQAHRVAFVRRLVVARADHRRHVADRDRERVGMHPAVVVRDGHRHRVH